MSRVSVLTHSV